MRVQALLVAQLLEFRRNPSHMLLPFAMLVLTAVWGLLAKAEASPQFFASASLLMTAYMVSMQYPLVSLSEEREKRTLEALFLSPARPSEVIATKALVAVVVCALVDVISLAIYKVTPTQPAVLILANLLAALFAFSIGTVIGLLAPDQKTAAAIGAPVMIFGLLGSVIPWEHVIPRVWDVMAWLPTRPLLELMQFGLNGKSVPVARDMAVMAAYTALALFFCLRQVRRLAHTR